MTRLAGAGVVGLVGLGLAAGPLVLVGARRLLQAQARSTRRAIGKPLGEEPFALDRIYQRKRGDALGLLVLGDSLAAGLGATRPRQTLGVHLATRLARSADRAVHDVIHRVPLDDSVQQLGFVVRALHEQGVTVVVGTCPDLASVLLVPQPLRTLAGRASRRLASAQRDVVTRNGGFAVSLGDLVGPSFLEQPDRMFSLDRFHPAGPGYRRTAKALLPSVLAGLGLGGGGPGGPGVGVLPEGHHGPRCVPTPSPG